MTDLSTTQDHLYRGRLVLEQPVDGYRFGTDAMILAAAVEAKPGQHVLELGCGVGGALLAAAMRLEHVRFTGIEKEEAYFTLLRRNIEANDMSKRIHSIQGDIQDKNLFKALGQFDHVFANPPYFVRYEDDKTSPLRRAARQEDPKGLSDWMKAANRFLKPKGTVTFIHNAERLGELIAELGAFCGNIRIFPLWPRTGQNARRLIIKGIKGSRAPLLILPGLVLHEEEACFTKKASDIINGKALWHSW